MKTITTKKLNIIKGDKLKNYVIDSIIDIDPKDRMGYIEDVLRSGCISGMVSGLIYYEDTSKFYNEFKEEIFNTMVVAAENMGHNNIYDMFKGVTSLQDEENLRAWFGYEETLRNIANELKLEL